MITAKDIKKNLKKKVRLQFYNKFIGYRTWYTTYWDVKILRLEKKIIVCKPLGKGQKCEMNVPMNLVKSMELKN